VPFDGMFANVQVSNDFLEDSGSHIERTIGASAIGTGIFDSSSSGSMWTSNGDLSATVFAFTVHVSILFVVLNDETNH
jgi:hypothetical protein